MRVWILLAFFFVAVRSDAQLLERPEATPVDEAHVRELAAVGVAASAEAQRTLDARMLPFDLTWGLQ